MNQPAISVRNLSKCYKLGTIGRHTLVDEAQYLWHKIRGKDPRQHFSKIGHTATEARKVQAEKEGDQEFWALRDVSFDVQPGEVIGVIGRNGAGKSTLLKILTRITEHTSGEAFINGRVASLLEVGTGFHPELTGRENVYMNGTILGMKKREIDAKFDEIVEFSELAKFIDTPVKRYSSGMYVRLAFAVAAHLDPEILLVDEVLAVGDAQFQKKCLGKMRDIAGQGRTVLFVSHNMTALSALCHRAVLLVGGKVFATGLVDDVVGVYVGSGGVNDGFCRVEDAVCRVGRREYSSLESVELLDSTGCRCGNLLMGRPYSVILCFSVHKKIVEMEIGWLIASQNGAPLHTFVSRWEGAPKEFGLGRYQAKCDVPNMDIMPGTYSLTPWVKRRGARVDDEVESALNFNSVGCDLTGSQPYFEAYKDAGVFQRSQWTIKQH